MKHNVYLNRRKQLKISDDPVFKYVFAKGSEMSNNNAKFLMEAILQKKIHTITLLDRECFSAGIMGKQVRFDCAYLINQSITVIIEMQKHKKKNDNQRFSHYANLISTHNIKIGNPYVEGSVYIITILDYKLSPYTSTRKPQRIYRRMMDGRKYCADEIIIPVEITGIQYLWQRDVNELTTIDALRLWMKYAHREEYADRIKMLREKEEGIDMLEKTMEHAVSATEEFFMLKDKVDAYYDQKDREYEIKKANQKKRKYKRKFEQEQLLRKQEQAKLEQEQAKREQEQMLRKQEQAKREQEQMLRNRIIHKLHKEGKSITEIADFMEIDIHIVRKILQTDAF